MIARQQPPLRATSGSPRSTRLPILRAKASRTRRDDRTRARDPRQTQRTKNRHVPAPPGGQPCSTAPTDQRGPTRAWAPSGRESYRSRACSQRPREAQSPSTSNPPAALEGSCGAGRVAGGESAHLLVSWVGERAARASRHDNIHDCMLSWMPSIFRRKARHVGPLRGAPD
jgi:hypothetical protein